MARKAAETAYSKAIRLISLEEKCSTPEAATKLLAWTQERVPELLAVDAKYRPHPATWLNNGRYRDDVAQYGRPAPVGASRPEPHVGDPAGGLVIERIGRYLSGTRKMMGELAGHLP